MHDYNLEWDYDIDRKAPKEWVTYVNTLKLPLYKRVLKKFHLFSDISWGFIKHDNEDFLGIYVDGTCEAPVIGLHWKQIATCHLASHISIEDVLATTFYHEVAHAIQDYLGIPYNEDEAEDFAFFLFEFGKVHQFWKINHGIEI